MKNVTKTNVLFATTVLIYIILVYTVRLIPTSMMTVNMLLVLPEIILLVPSLLYILFLRPSTVENVSLSMVSVGTLVKTALGTVALLPLISIINAISTTVSHNGVSDTLDVVVYRNPVWLNLIIMALLPAVVEEFIFRGLILNGYKKRNPLKAILLSSILFGLIHMNLNQFSYAFVIGIVLALLAYATGSLVPSILAHFIINGISVIMSHLIAENRTVEAVEEIALSAKDIAIAYSSLAVMALIGIVVFVALYRSICKSNRGIANVERIFKMPYREEYDENEGKFIDGYLLLGVGICLIYIILYETM